MEAVLDQSPPTLAGLVAAAVGGDRDAFRELVEPDLAAAYGTARIVTRSGSLRRSGKAVARLAGVSGSISGPDKRKCAAQGAARGLKRGVSRLVAGSSSPQAASSSATELRLTSAASRAARAVSTRACRRSILPARQDT